MFQNIGCRIFLKQPARKNPAPAFGVIGPRRPLPHSHADKGALIGIGFPRCCPFARAHKQSDFAETHRFARFQFEIARVAIAFVKQADDGHALGHRRSGLFALNRGQISRRGSFCRSSLGRFGGWLFGLLVTGSQSQRRAKQKGYTRSPHAASGLHA
jgi:hypothetical protein